MLLFSFTNSRVKGGRKAKNASEQYADTEGHFNEVKAHNSDTKIKMGSAIGGIGALDLP